MNETQTVAVVVRGRTVIIPLADAVAEYFRLDSLSERPLTDKERAVHAALTFTLGTLPTTDSAPQLYAEGEPQGPGK